MLKHLAVLTVLSLGSALAAHADAITGYYSASGTDSFSSTSFQFGNAAVSGAVGGTFANYFSAGTPVDFHQAPITYINGFNSVAGGPLSLFSVVTPTEVFTFMLTDFTAGYINNGTNGCGPGSTCLDMTGDGYFVGTGVLNGTSSAAVFTFTSQYAPGQSVATLTSFSASSAVLSTVPEPGPLALVGTGLLGLCGFVRRKCLA